MRLKVALLSKTENPALPLNYSYYLASMIYRAMERGDGRLSLEMHRPNTPKLFTFSRLFVPGRKFRIEGDKMFIDAEEVQFYFSTPRKEVAEKLVEGLLAKPEVRIADCEFAISEICVMREREIKGREKFVTMSPIHVSTVEVSGAVKRKVDLYPDSEKFYEVLRKNLVKKYEMIHGAKPKAEELEVRPFNVRTKRVRVKNTENRCVEMVFEAKGNPELLEVGYKAGFGSKNSMGFGMVKGV